MPASARPDERARSSATPGPPSPQRPTPSIERLWLLLYRLPPTSVLLGKPQPEAPTAGGTVHCFFTDGIPLLTVDFDRLGLCRGERLLDLGCGAGRHAFEAYRRGARVVAFDQDAKELAGLQETLTAMSAAGEGEHGGARTEQGDALNLPFDDGEFDRLIAAEVLEHIPDDRRAINELARVVRPGGSIAVTVPRFWPERICWALSDEYHEIEGGHVRIYRADTLAGQLSQAGLEVTGRDHVHALHAPYWWLKCAVGVANDDNPLVRTYHRLLVWDLMKKPVLTRVAERLLDPALGKSVVLYARKLT